ncbi:MAG TPA: hypothetical protein VEX66_04170 [Microlunatus sp.]|nr:hypothetical protein [Microlunatus sp.]
MPPLLVFLSAAAVLAQQIGLYGRSGPVQLGWFPAADKAQHALGFALPMFLVLTTLESYAARAGRTLRPLWSAVIASVFTANAVVSELYQTRPGSGRSGDPSDAVADLVGIALGWLVFRLLRGRWAGGRLRSQGAA